jgi:hypothetical protein
MYQPEHVIFSKHRIAAHCSPYYAREFKDGFNPLGRKHRFGLKTCCRREWSQITVMTAVREEKYNLLMHKLKIL